MDFSSADMIGGGHHGWNQVPTRLKSVFRLGGHPYSRLEASASRVEAIALRLKDVFRV